VNHLFRPWITGVAAGQNVGGAEKCGVPKATDGTRGTVGDQDPLAELGLIDSNEPLLGDVGTYRLAFSFDHLVAARDLFKANGEGDRSGADNVHKRRPH
jgi:hypothetical protein